MRCSYLVAIRRFSSVRRPTSFLESLILPPPGASGKMKDPGNEVVRRLPEDTCFCFPKDAIKNVRVDSLSCFPAITPIKQSVKVSWK